MPRLFTAIELPQFAKDGLLALKADDIAPSKWATPDQLHLTLHFIGDVPDAVANAYKRILDTVSVPSFEMNIAGVGQFPPEDRPRVIWAGVDNTPELRALHFAVGGALEEEGYERDERRYFPHITMMRFRQPPRRGRASTWVNEHMDLHIDAIPVTEFVLFASILSPEGSRYIPLKKYPLET